MSILSEKLLLKFFWVFDTLFLLGYCSLMFLVVSAGANSFAAPADGILVLGHAIDENHHPSPWLNERLNTAIRLYQNGYGDYIIVSGGLGQEDIPVAYVMAQYLIDRGIEKSSILIEANSNNTYENFKYSALLAKEHNIESLMVITNGFHMYRSLLLGQQYFATLIPVIAEAPVGAELIFAYLREPFSIVFNFIRYMPF